MANYRICSIPDCSKPSVCRGWCNMHYTRFKRHGDPNVTLTTAEGEGLAFLFSHVGYEGSDCVEWPYSRTGHGYGQTYYKGNVVQCHRLMCILAHGEPDAPKMQAAHWCGNTSCINPKHIRWATPRENIADKYQLHGWTPTRDALGRITGIVQA